jgi:hypothetical protein
MYGKGVWCSEKFCRSGKIFGPLKWYTDRNIFGDGGGGRGRRNEFIPQTIFSGLVGHNPKKSGKFLSAPLIFSFPYAHGRASVKRAPTHFKMSLISNRTKKIKCRLLGSMRCFHVTPSSKWIFKTYTNDTVLRRFPFSLSVFKELVNEN